MANNPNNNNLVGGLPSTATPVFYPTEINK